MDELSEERYGAPPQRERPAPLAPYELRQTLLTMVALLARALDEDDAKRTARRYRR